MNLTERKLKDGMILRPRTVGDLADALHTVSSNLTNGMYRKGRRYASPASVLGTKSFTGSASADEYATILRDGWPEGISGMQEELAGITSDSADRLEFVRNVAGAFPIVPAHLAGNPMSMLQPVQQQSEHVRGLTLVINGGFNCAVQSKTAKTYAQSVMRLIAWLQAERLDAAVYIAITMSAGGTKLLYLIPLRLLGDVFQPERIAACCHPSFLRRAWFALIEQEYVDASLKGCDMCTSHYGCPIVPDLDQLAEALPDAQSIILMPEVGSSDPTKAVQEAINLKFRRT